MGIRNAVPVAFRPAGISDTLDGSTSFPGAMSLLQNLIPDPSTKNLWQCRPAAQKVVDFNTQGGAFNAAQFSTAFQIGFATGGAFSPGVTAGFISCLVVLGNYVYGMIATGRNPGHDEPFAYNLLTNLFTVISGVTNANTPASPATSGDWVPPDMALIGTKLIVTHSGFTGAGGVYFGVLDIANTAAPAWSGNNLTGAITFTIPPSAVEQFNGRAWYIINPPTGQPAVVFSDILAPTVVTNANQVLTFGDSLPLTALGGLPLNNQLGGVIQSLMVFKGVTNVYQVTGDAATLPAANLAVNSLNIATGTLAPNTIVPTPLGLAFVASDGLRIIDFTARVSDPIGHDGQGKTLPFLFALSPSRMAAAANGNILRIQVQDGSTTGSPFVEFWYDFVRKVWSGPHTFPPSLIARYLNTFIMSPIGVLATLWRSDWVQSLTSTFVENGVQLTFNWLSSFFPDTDQMCQIAMVESTIYMAFSAGQSGYSVSALDQNGIVLGNVQLQFTGTASLWGSMIWGQSLWGGVQAPLAPHVLQWPAPLEFRRMQLQVVGPSALGARIGTLHMRYQKLGYLQEGVVP
jgi:hypothetical protein